MKLNLKATNLELIEQLKTKIQEKLGGFDKYFQNIQQVDVEVGLTKLGQNKGKIYFCEVNLSVPKKLIRYRREGEDLMKAVNEVKRGIQMESKKYKERI